MSNAGLAKGLMVLGCVILFAVILNPKVTLHFAKNAQNRGKSVESTCLYVWFMVQVFLIISLVYLPFYLVGIK